MANRKAGNKGGRETEAERWNLTFYRLPSTFYILLFTVPYLLFSAFAYALTEKDFQKDMAYYHRTAKTQNLNANDRLHILDRFRQKYRDAEFDLTELYTEINRWTTAKLKEPKSSGAAKKALETKPKKKSGKINSILVTDSDKVTRVIIEGEGIKEYKEVFQKNEKGIQPPVLILYLYQMEEKLKPTSKNFVIKTGAVRQVQTRQISLRPPTVQLSISFREELPYTLDAKENQLLLTIDKKVVQARDEKEESVLSSTQGAIAPTPPATTEGTEITLAAATNYSYRSPQYILKQGDFLEIKVKPFELSQRQLVLEDGTIEFLYTGKMRVAGRTILEAEKLLATSLSQYLQVEEVKIALQSAGAGQVLLVGQVKSPGIYILDKPLKCFELISKSGGFLPDADKKNVLIYSASGEKMSTLLFDIEEFLTTADPEKDLNLRPGDKIEVPRVKDSLFVFGAVKNQGFVPYKSGMKMMQAIALAGGMDSQRQGNKIRIFRSEGDEKIAQEIDIRRHLRKLPDGDIPIQPEDFIYVSEKKGGQSENFKTVLLPWGIFLASLGVILALLL